jgi:hypothetical protein
MPGADYAVSIPTSPPPSNLSAYSRFIHEHTKRQMEAQGAMTDRISGSSTRTSGSSGSSTTTNGTSPSEYQT